MSASECANIKSSARGGHIAENLPTTLPVGSPPELPVTSMTRYTKGLKETPFNATAFKCWLLKSKRVTAKKASKQWNTLPGLQQGVSRKGSGATTKKVTKHNTEVTDDAGAKTLTSTPHNGIASH